MIIYHCDSDNVGNDQIEQDPFAIADSADGILGYYANAIISCMFLCNNHDDTYDMWVYHHISLR